MAKINLNDVENYKGGGGAGYFALKNDKEVAHVHFMYNDVEDVTPYVVHRVKIGETERYVNCLRRYDQPLDDCPLCKAGNRQQVKLFVPLYNLDEDKVQTWERGRNFIGKLTGLFPRFATEKPLVSTVFEIERNGKPKDTSTTYEIYNVETTDTTLEDLPEAPEVLGTIVLDKNADEMQYYLDNGEFPSEETKTPERKTFQRRTESTSAHTYQRRTPINGKTERF